MERVKDVKVQKLVQVRMLLRLFLSGESIIFNRNADRDVTCAQVDLVFDGETDSESDGEIDGEVDGEVDCEIVFEIDCQIQEKFVLGQAVLS